MEGGEGPVPSPCSWGTSSLQVCRIPATVLREQLLPSLRDGHVTQSWPIRALCLRASRMGSEHMTQGALES